MTAADLGGFLSDQPLLALTIAAILAVAASRMLAPQMRRSAALLRGAGYLGMLAALLLTVAQSAYHSARSDVALTLAKPSLSVSGRETRIPIGPDGHFWVDAQVNGETQRFLIDTGATYTGVSETAARDLQIEPDAMAMPLELNTANGTIAAHVGRATTFTFGSIAVRNLQIAIAPDTSGDTGVIGMNLLSRLASWRVEGETLILVPKEEER